MRPVAPTSLPHATTSDEKVSGLCVGKASTFFSHYAQIRDYVLPKGTMIFANLCKSDAYLGYLTKLTPL